MIAPILDIDFYFTWEYLACRAGLLPTVDIRMQKEAVYDLTQEGCKSGSPDTLSGPEVLYERNLHGVHKATFLRFKLMPQVLPAVR